MILADRTNGRGYAVQCCVRLSVVCMECTVAKRCVLEQKLLLTAYRKSYNYEKSISTRMNDLTFVYRSLKSCQPLRHICH